MKQEASTTVTAMNLARGLVWLSFLLPLAAEGCIVRVESMNCTRKEVTNIHYTCHTNTTDDCSCVFENPQRTDLGWQKLCKKKNALKTKKHIVKRQVRNTNYCRDIQPPRPGNVSCHASSREITCTGKCSSGYKFEDGTKEQAYTCRYSEGVWRPSSSYPECQPDCIPPCENGGICKSPGLCSCSREFRGNFCQYAYELCGIQKKPNIASSWRCNFTRRETTCDVSCHPPGSVESESAAVRHVCSIEGSWTPPLPDCVQVVGRCTDPGDVENGSRISSFTVFPLSTRVSYKCNEGHETHGDGVIHCQEDGTWLPEKPRCKQKKERVTERPSTEVQVANFPTDQCQRPNAPKASVIHLSFPDARPLKNLFNAELPVIERLFFTLNSSNNPDEDFTLRQSGFPIGTRVQYKCKSRFYKLYGSEYQTCLSTRTWSGHQPACVPECGKSDSPKTPFVVNGDPSKVGEWPWMVGLAFKESDGLELRCGGVLISENWILTAAHCVTRHLSSIPIEEKRLLIFCGKHFRKFTEADDAIQVKEVKQIIVHDEYQFQLFDADIALVHLESAVELTTRVQPICLPTEITTRENVRDSQKGIVLGWGLTENRTYSETLRETVLPVVSHEKCEEAYRKGLRTITVTHNMFCAGFNSSNSDTCIGDSGGPFMFSNGPPNEKRWYLEGLVSWGSESGCAIANHYSGFTQVSKFVPWINMFI